MLRFCLALEATGICSGAWVLGWLTEKAFGWQTDEVYIGFFNFKKVVLFDFK